MSSPELHHFDTEYSEELLSLLQSQAPFTSQQSMSRRPIKPATEQPIIPATITDPHIVDKKVDMGVGMDLGGGVDDDDLLSPQTPTTNKKRKAAQSSAAGGGNAGGGGGGGGGASGALAPAKRPRTNTPWTAAEEQRLKAMRDAGNSWSEIAKTFPTRTEGSVKKHWYKDMHYAEFGEDESAALLAAIREYDTNKWKVIGQKVGKPAKACEQYAKEHFAGK
ncbi:hypothetical protein BZA05DRAFT_153098 [Tricharina praecox]|uniref:uncharacterized protein n=1 Tax=Tricharina praecox TaxID=43433 RepID=UPI00221FE3AF|nr:uncharacterized protein BZA05DRAFT_153098 [Tricharina praecox]KAI5844878.1 hypothetical protein BZA05DRAFT_153098 [Tricharina praecox]